MTLCSFDLMILGALNFRTHLALAVAGANVRCMFNHASNVL
jgi:hypothetical protein